MGRDPTGAQGKGNANDENTGGVHLTEAEVCVFCVLCLVLCCHCPKVMVVVVGLDLALFNMRKSFNLF